MADTADLIRRARELAAIAARATRHPAPYASDEDWEIIANAPDMGRVLTKLADELERLRKENDLLADKNNDLHNQVNLLARGVRCRYCKPHYAGGDA